MNKTELFVQGVLKPAFKEYMKFVEQNPKIDIISVIQLKNESILLTYKD